MKNVVKLVLLIIAAGGSAYADSITWTTVAPTPSPVTSKSYLKSAELAITAAAASLEKDGYIGTVYLSDSVTFTPTNGPTQVAVPEPASLALFGSGLALAAFRRRRRDSSPQTAPRLAVAS